jgi:hypothetical protein
MTSITTTASVPLRRDEAGRLVGKTMGLVALAAGVFAVGAYVGRDLSGGWAICWSLASLAVLPALHVAAQRAEQLAVGLLFGFGLALGLHRTGRELLRRRRSAVGLAGGRGDGVDVVPPAMRRGATSRRSRARKARRQGGDGFDVRDDAPRRAGVDDPRPQHITLYHRPALASRATRDAAALATPRSSRPPDLRRPLRRLARQTLVRERYRAADS